MYPNPNAWGLLSHIQRRILTLIFNGESDQQIAFALGCDRTTVQTHLVRVKKTLGAKTRVHVFNLVFARGDLRECDDPAWQEHLRQATELREQELVTRAAKGRWGDDVTVRPRGDREKARVQPARDSTGCPVVRG